MFYRLPDFDYYKPKTLSEALEIISKLKDFKILAGGTDLLIDLRIRRYTPKNIVDISGIKELRYIVDEGNKVRIGALTTLQELADSPIIKSKLPLLAEAANQIASWQIRSMGTVGGNLCNASPAADTAPPLMVYEAKLKLKSKKKERTIPITKFFKGPGLTVCEPDEMLTEIIIPHPPKGMGSKFIKIARTSMDLAKVNVAVALLISEDDVIEDVRIALGAVAPTPIRAWSAEEFLRDKEVSISNIKKAAKLVLKDISPISDVRASAEYRREMSVLLTIDSLIKSLSRINVKVEGWEL